MPRKVKHTHHIIQQIQVASMIPFLSENPTQSRDFWSPWFFKHTSHDRRRMIIRVQPNGSKYFVIFVCFELTTTKLWPNWRVNLSWALTQRFEFSETKLLGCFIEVQCFGGNSEMSMLSSDHGKFLRFTETVLDLRHVFFHRNLRVSRVKVSNQFKS